MWSNKNFPSLLVGMQNAAATLEDVSVKFYTITPTLLKLQQSFFWLLHQELKTDAHMRTCTWMFLAALFMVAQS